MTNWFLLQFTTKTIRYLLHFQYNIYCVEIPPLLLPGFQVYFYSNIHLKNVKFKYVKSILLNRQNEFQM